MATDKSDTQFDTFGSVYRRGRDDPQYQIDRLRMLCAFSARMVVTYARQLRDQQKRSRQIWDAKDFHEQQFEKLTAEIAELTKVTEEQRAWIARLEETHAKATSELKDWIEQLEEAKAYFTAQLESEKARRIELEGILSRLQRKWLGRVLIRLVTKQDQKEDNA